MDFSERLILGAVLAACSIVFWVALFWQIKNKYILRDVPAKDWKSFRIFYFGLKRHDVVTSKNHPNLYNLMIVFDILIAFGTTILTALVFFVG